MVIDRKKFWDAARDAPFPHRVSPEQVKGTEPLLVYWENTYADGDIRWLAYILATVFHETGTRMIPVREGFAKTNAAAVATVTKMFKQGRISKNYAAPIGGVSFYGRGRVQNTWQKNYIKLRKRFGQPFDTKPDLLLDPEIDTPVTIEGHVEGIWTGHKLADYFEGDKSDPRGARRIVNGTDKAAAIATYYLAFLNALHLAVTDTPAVAEVEDEEGDGPDTPAFQPAALLATGSPLDLADGKKLLKTMTTQGGIMQFLPGMGAVGTLLGYVKDPYVLAFVAILGVLILAGLAMVIFGRKRIRTQYGV